jgi:hypothetical protein
MPILPTRKGQDGRGQKQPIDAGQLGSRDDSEITLNRKGLLVKVRVEYEIPTEAGMDVESMYDAVEFQTYQAGDHENWGEAVLDFIRPSIYDAQSVLLEALHLISDGQNLRPFLVWQKRQKVLDLVEWLQAGLAEADKDPSTQHLRATLTEGE